MHYNHDVHTTEITRLLLAYESAAHPACPTFDWDAWPLIRNWIALTQAHQARVRPRPYPRPPAFIPMGLRSLSATPRWALATRGRGFGPVPASEVAIVTHANRSQWLGDAYYRYMADPVVRMLSDEGVSAVAWQRGRPMWPQFRPAFFCEGPLYAASIVHHLSQTCRLPRRPPSWHADIAEWHRRSFGQELPWSVVARELRSVEAMRRVYEGWFERAGTRLVLIDCWYDSPSVAAILAARSLGVHALDIQHGIQGAAHYAYSGWALRHRPEQLCAFPSGFWVWGARDAAALFDNNGPFLDANRVFTAGYLWLNEWLAPGNRVLLDCDAAAARLVAESRRTILVTLQDPRHVEEAFQLASEGPADWLWLLRVHRGWREKGSDVELEATRRGLPRVLSVQPTMLPLYALLRHVDVHVTWASTCAVEAAAFGVPTVLLDEAARSIFQDYISQGIMTVANESGGAVTGIENAAFSEPRDAPAALDAFADPTTARNELRRLLTTTCVSV